MSDQPSIEQAGPPEAIAVVGMAGRFPKAPDLETFWRNLQQGVEGISFLSDDELRVLGVPEAHLQASNFVKASPLLDEIDRFDAAFFGYAPSEARLLDPQHRLFLECSWHALEHAAIDPTRSDATIGVFGGTSLSTYLLFNVLPNPQYADPEHTFSAMVSNDKDFLCSRVAYHFDLRGPTLDVQTGCSTSLVAVHLACEALLSFQCDVALAGGVSVNVPQRSGYFYEEGDITSPDGHCRAFDAEARGTLFGSGVGVVVLKRLSDALRDGDAIQAVLLSSAVNNDGAQKVGYTAPSVNGQHEVIARALALAGVEAQSIGYVEAHGTGTVLGDPIEVAALTRAFRDETDARQFCAIGSVKTNIGHLDAAAGIAGLIKTVLALQHGQIPPSLNFQTPNPRLELESSPFYVSTSCTPWPDNGGPRRAGISAFGIGGTNAHVVAEQPPPAPPTDQPQRRPKLLLLSARSQDALERATQRLHDYLEQHPDADLSDVAYTLQVGRARWEWRRALVCHDSAEARQLLAAPPTGRVFTTNQDQTERPLVFLFPSSGAQYAEMGRALYDSEPLFRQIIDRCAAILQPQLGYDIRQLLYPAQPDPAQAEQFKTPTLAQPALFMVEYALAQLLISWGATPAALIGHSLSEYVAACVAGVFTLEDALATVLVRGRLLAGLPDGAMLSVLAERQTIEPLLADGVSFAAINSPAQCVVSGPTEAILQLGKRLEAHEIDYRQIPINTAGHSQLVEQILPEFVAWMRTITLRPPSIPFISGVTGSWISAAQATDPAYWGQHLRQPVQFQAGVATLLAEPAYLFVEVGPGTALSRLVAAQAGRQRADDILSTLAHQREGIPDDTALQMALGRLWAGGATIDWSAFYGDERRRRVRLPGYPFERQRYWIEPQAAGALAAQASLRQPEIADWIYTHSWQQTPPGQFVGELPPHTWLLFVNDDPFSRQLTELLRASGQYVISVTAGERFVSESQSYQIQPGRGDDYLALLQQLAQQGQRPDYLLHLWSLRPADDLPAVQRYGYNALIHLARAWPTDWSEPTSWWVVGSRMHRIESGDSINPNYAINAGPCRTIPQEYPQITCYQADLGTPTEQTARYLLADILAAPQERVLAYRGTQRWRQWLMPLRLSEQAPQISQLRTGGTYLITGGMGQLGLQWASYLAQHYQAKLALVSRTAFPPRQNWPQHLAAGDRFANQIRQIQAIEEAGGELAIIAADVASETQLREAIVQTQRRFGQLHGIIHAAGVAGGKAVKLLADFEPGEREVQFGAKIYGTYALSRLVPGLGLDVVLLVSSTAAILGGYGLTAYSAANGFLDAFVASPQAQGTRWLSVNLDIISEWSHAPNAEQHGLTLRESSDVFERLVTRAPAAQTIVSATELVSRWEHWIVQAGRRAAHNQEHDTGTGHQRPALDTAYIAPTTPHEQVIAGIWQQTLGIDQIGIDDNFFTLGGDSLFAVRVMSRLNKALKIDVPVVSLYEGGMTVRALAAMVDGLEREQSQPSQAPDQAPSPEQHSDRQSRLLQQRARRSGLQDEPVSS